MGGHLSEAKPAQHIYLFSIILGLQNIEKYISVKNNQEKNGLKYKMKNSNAYNTK